MKDGKKQYAGEKEARDIAEKLQGPFVDQLYGSGDSPNFLSRLVSLVSEETQPSRDDLTKSEQKFFGEQLKRTLRSLDQQNKGSVLMLKGERNVFGMSVPIDMENTRARRSLARSGAPVETVSRDVASFHFMTLFADAVRNALSSGGGGTGATSGGGSGFPFTANCNLSGWSLEYWPQFFVSPTRFGSSLTWPVQGHLPTSGNYYFQGLQNLVVRQDPTPHFASTINNATIVTL